VKSTGEPLIGAIDAGTTGVRCVLHDEHARPVASAYREVPVTTPRPGWVEQDPALILAATIETLADVLGAPAARGRSIAAVGLANQRETVIAWDRKSGRALHPAIVWQDRRTAARCDDLSGDEVQLIRGRTGLRPDPYFSATKIEWLLQHVPVLGARAAAGTSLVSTVDAWLLRHLTGEHATDDTNASRTMVFDIERREWDAELLGVFGIPRTCLPRVGRSLSMFGAIRSDLVGGRSVPLAGILGDQQAALLGQGIATKGKAQATWGTGAFLLMDTGAARPPSRSGLIATVARTGPGRTASYALEGSVFVAGAAIQWLRDSLGLLRDAADSQALARSVHSTEGVVFVPALAGLGAPYWDPDARGLIVGITRGTRPAHVVRAALESIAYQTHDVVRAMERDIGRPLEELRVGGRVAENDFLCQFQSDVLGIPVVRPRNPETTALGAAYAAGIAVGLWDEADVVGRLWEAQRRFVPTLSVEQRDELVERWTRAVERSRRWDEGRDPTGQLKGSR